MMPPCIVARVGFWCFFAMFMPSTMTRSAPGNTRVIVARPPTSVPASTTTSSPFFSFNFVFIELEHLRREGHDPHEAAVAELAPDGTEDARAPRLHLVVDEHGGVLVEPDVTAVRTTPLLLGPHDDALHDVALLHRRARNGVLDRRDEDVADPRVAASGAAEHLDAQHLTRAAVVSNLEPGLFSNHRARSRTSTIRQRLCLETRP